MGKLINEIGNRYGRLIVKQISEISKDGARWLCQCDCGNEIIIRGISLRKCATKSCGCLRREYSSQKRAINLVGKKYGRLTVITRQGSSKHGQAMWLCKCDCGSEKITTGELLRKNKVKSCGCLKRSLSTGEASFNALFAARKQTAKQRGYEWKLTKDQFRVLTKQHCFYCGLEPKQHSSYRTHYGAYTYNGLDRIDNNIGYIIDNVVSCCKDCNYAKRKMTVEAFKDWIRKVYNHLIANEV